MHVQTLTLRLEILKVLLVLHKQALSIGTVRESLTFFDSGGREYTFNFTMLEQPNCHDLQVVRMTVERPDEETLQLLIYLLGEPVQSSEREIVFNLES